MSEAVRSLLPEVARAIIHGVHPVQTAACALALATLACESVPQSTAVVDNRYPPSSTGELVVYRAQFETAYFDVAVSPGSSSSPQSTVPTSDDMAYVLLAPGWDPTSDAGPTSFIVLESNKPLAAAAREVVHIAVADSTFRGRCDAGSFLTQEEADLITGAFFSDIFASVKYEATLCATTPLSDAGSQ